MSTASVTRFFAISCATVALLLSSTALVRAQPAPASSAQINATGTLTVNIVGGRNTKGKIIVWLFRGPQGFPNDTSRIFRQQSILIEPGSMTARAVFKDLPPDAFAVTVLHDENDNGKMDKNFLGIPREGFGASNNPRKMRAPTFEEAKFSMNAPEYNVEIVLRYI